MQLYICLCLCYISCKKYLIFDYPSNYQDSNNESLFGTMEKTLRLLEMGFSEKEVSLAIERLGQ